MHRRLSRTYSLTLAVQVALTTIGDGRARDSPRSVAKSKAARRTMCTGPPSRQTLYRVHLTSCSSAGMKPELANLLARARHA